MSFLKGLGGVLGGMSAGYADPTFAAKKKMEEDLLKQRHEQMKGIMDYEDELRRKAKDREEAEIVSALATTLPNEPQVSGLPPRDPMANAQLERNKAKALNSLQGIGGAQRILGGLGSQEDIGRTNALGELATGRFKLATTSALLPRAGETAEARQFADFGKAKADTEVAKNVGGNAILDRSLIEKDMANKFLGADVKGGELKATLEDQKFANEMRSVTQNLAKKAAELGLAGDDSKIELAKLAKFILEGGDTSGLSEGQKILVGIMNKDLTEEQLKAMMIRAQNSGNNINFGALLGGLGGSGTSSLPAPQTAPNGTTNAPSGTSSLGAPVASPGGDDSIILNGRKIKLNGA